MAMQSPRAARRALEKYRNTVAKLKEDNDELRVKLMRSQKLERKNKKKKPKRGRRDRLSSTLPFDETSLRILLGIPDASLVTVKIPEGKKMGCIMEESETNGISVIKVHKRLPVAVPGILPGDIVAGVNNKSVRVTGFSKHTARWAFFYRKHA